MDTIFDIIEKYKLEIFLFLIGCSILSFILRKAFPGKEKILLFNQIMKIWLSTFLILPFVHIIVSAIVALLFESNEPWSDSFFKLGIFLPMYAFFGVLILCFYYLVTDILLFSFFRKTEWIGYKLLLQWLPFVIPLFKDPVNFKLFIPTLIAAQVVRYFIIKRIFKTITN
jgi:hypothetical protein